MPKIAHLADLHYCQKHIFWVSRAMQHAVATAIDAGCDLAVIAGDSFDSALSTHDPAFLDFVRQVVTLSDHMPVVILAGTRSHDRPGSLDVLREFPARNQIIVADTIGEYEVSGVRICTLPSLNKADPEVMRMGAVAWTAERLAEFAPDMGLLPTILVTHGTVTGCTTESGYAMVSPDHEFSVEALAGACCDAVMLGHIHRHQAWPNVRTSVGGVTTIAYPGSLARLVHGHHDPVGFLIWDIEPGRATFEFHPSPARRLLEIDFPEAPDMEDLRALAESADPDDAVRIRWTLDEEHAHIVDKQAIRDLFAHCDGGKGPKLEPTILPIQRVRAEGIGKAATLADKLTHWFETTGSAGSLADVLPLLEEVQAGAPADIVDRIVRPETDATEPMRIAA